jgi:protein SCO1/2
MMRLSTLFVALATGLSCAPAQAHDHEHMHHADMQAAQPLSGASIYNLGSRWTDQDDKAVALDSLRGRPVVAAMAYTSCKNVCPLIVANMTAIERAARDKGVANLHFVFFSLDSAVDNPAKLKAYADERGLDPADWTLLHGDEKAVRDLAAALGVRYRPDGQGGFDHSTVISLLDDKGEIVFQKVDAAPDLNEFVARIETLAQTKK